MKSNNLWSDISPQDSALLADIVEVDSLPSITREDEGDVRYAFYVSTRHGLRYECSSISKIQVLSNWFCCLIRRLNCGHWFEISKPFHVFCQVDSWLLALHDCKLVCGNGTSGSNTGR